MEQLTLTDLQWFEEICRAQWRGLFELFNNVKTLHLHLTRDLAWRACRSLGSENGRWPLRLLPQLEEITYEIRNDIGDDIERLINERQAVGHPVRLHRVACLYLSVYLSAILTVTLVLIPVTTTNVRITPGP